jgi:molybdopterin molybdotransferase
MISLEEAQSRLIALAQPVTVERAPLINAAGRWAAEPVLAKRTQPMRDLSAMDGYAVAAKDMPGPWIVIGQSAAGAGFAGKMGPSEAVRIFTGAPLPQGADSIIIQEDVTRDGDTIRVSPSLHVPMGQHVRFAGSDFKMNDILVAQGECLTAARIALAAMGGYGDLLVRRRISVDILSTGDELVPPGHILGEDQIPNSNGVMIAVMLGDLPCDVTILPIAADTMDASIAAIKASTADILVTCGGASVGDHDLVRPALTACGAELDFWKVAMRPGKPVMAGRQGDRLVLGLPGNPVSAYVTTLLFLRPLIAVLGGATQFLPIHRQAQLDCTLPANASRTDHLRGRLTESGVTNVGLNDSAALKSLSQSDVLIVRAPDALPAKIGDMVDILLLA